jgi:UDP-3-O-[3-hydroxymyristoyl] glucosamine N-acyltransferase
MTTLSIILAWFEKRDHAIKRGALADNHRIVRLRAVDEAEIDHITFLTSKYKASYDSLLQATKSQVIVVDKELFNNPLLASFADKTFIASDNPKQDVVALYAAVFLADGASAESFIHPTAVVSEHVTIGEHVHIGAHVSIEGHVVIGDRCRIGAGTVIKTDITLGNDVVMGANNVLGGDGFGYVKNETTGTYDLFPHLGGIIIGNNVHIGNNTCIDRGSLKDTIIHHGVKIDNLVHIAHNVNIGANSLIIACSMIAGSVVIGENCWVAPCSTIRNAIEIGDNSTTGMGSVVTKSVAANQVVTGSPAVPLEEFMKLRAAQKKWLKDPE